MVACPACQQPVKASDINRHLDSQCTQHIAVNGADDDDEPVRQNLLGSQLGSSTQIQGKRTSRALEFFTPLAKRSSAVPVRERDDVRLRAVASSPTLPSSFGRPNAEVHCSPIAPSPPSLASADAVIAYGSASGSTLQNGKRAGEQLDGERPMNEPDSPNNTRAVKKIRTVDRHAPLAERMRPRSLDEVVGQRIVAQGGVLRELMGRASIPSMILWGGPGTGKTTIARLLAQTAGARFVEINSTASGVAECKKLFAEARAELGLTGRRTIIFCDEIHRFSKSQQDVFLGPVEAGHVTLIGATTENPSFKVQSALLSRCRTFTLDKLTEDDVFGVLKRAMAREIPDLSTPSESPAMDADGERPDEQPLERGPTLRPAHRLLTDENDALLHYLAAFADGDARTGLNLLELALELCNRPDITVEDIKKSLTQTLVYDRAGDQHYDTISAFHKSVRGSNADAALYYLARMLQSGEDPLYIARRMVVIASEDVGLADNNMLSLATATYTAAEKIGMPECRINLAHCAVALCLAPKSVRAYRGLNAAYAALGEPGIAGLPVPIHLRNAPTRLMKELGYGKEYKYNPDYFEGRVKQEYLPEKLEGRRFLGAKDLGDEVDPDVLAAREKDQGNDDVDDSAMAAEILLGPDGD